MSCAETWSSLHRIRQHSIHHKEEAAAAAARSGHPAHANPLHPRHSVAALRQNPSRVLLQHRSCSAPRVPRVLTKWKSCSTCWPVVYIPPLRVSSVTRLNKRLVSSSFCQCWRNSAGAMLQARLTRSCQGPRTGKGPRKDRWRHRN